jgi:hypothetical protein
VLVVGPVAEDHDGIENGGITGRYKSQVYILQKMGNFDATPLLFSEFSSGVAFPIPVT